MLRVISQLFHRYFHDDEAIIFALLILSTALVIYFWGAVLTPLFAALIVAYVLSPSVDALVRLKVPRTLAVSLISLVFLSVLILVLLGMIPLLWAQLNTLVTEMPRMLDELQKLLVALPEQLPDFVSVEQVDIWLAEVNMSSIGSGLAELLPSVVTFSLASIPNVVSMLIYLIIVPLIVFFVLKDRSELWASFSSLLPKRRSILNKVGHEMNVQIANYIRGKFIEILIVGGVSFIVLSAFGLNYAALLSLLVGLSVLIPYIGATSVTLPIALVALFQWGLTPMFYWVIVAYLIIQMLDGNVLVPILFSEANNLHPLSIIVAVLFFGGIWGFWGIFFSIPLATLVKAIYNAWPRLEEETEQQAE